MLEEMLRVQKAAIAKYDEAGAISALRTYLATYLAEGGDPEARLPDNSHMNLLDLAIEFEQYEIIRQLVDAGADINLVSELGWTSLTHAFDLELQSAIQANRPVEDETFRLTRLLLELGADPSVRDWQGRTARDVARDYGEWHLARFDALVCEVTDLSRESG